MRRRDFVALLVATVAWPLPAFAGAQRAHGLAPAIARDCRPHNVARSSPSRRLAVLAVPSNTGTPLAIREAEAAAGTFGMELMIVGVERVDEIDAALAKIEQARSDALYVFVEPMLFTNRAKLLAFAERTALPAMYQHSGLAREGALISYSPLFAAHYPLAAEYVHRILKGAKPAELPVAQSTTFELVINLKAARSLRIGVPVLLQAQADEVIE